MTAITNTFTVSLSVATISAVCAELESLGFDLVLLRTECDREWAKLWRTTWLTNHAVFLHSKLSAIHDSALRLDELADDASTEEAWEAVMHSQLAI